MKALLIPFAAFCSLGISGCRVVYTVHPLNTSEDAVEEPALVGQWASSSNSDDQFCILKADNHTYTMVISATDSKSDEDGKSAADAKSETATTMVGTYQITLVRLDDQLFADMVAKDLVVNGTKVEGPIGSVNHHVILKLDLTDSELGYKVLDSSAIRQANEQGYATLPYVEIDDGILLTAPTEELRFSVSHFADRLFETDEEHFTRVTDADAQASSPSPCSAIPPPSTPPQN